jgi:uncharacterized membrane protein (DUF485 family)
MNSAGNADSKKRADESQWDRIATSLQFQHLLLEKKLFIVPAFSFFLVYYLLLPVLLGYAPRLMSIRVFGTVTLAYLYALSQFLVGWTIAWLYMRASLRFDRLVQDLLKNEVIESDRIKKKGLAPEDNLAGRK